MRKILIAASVALALTSTARADTISDNLHAIAGLYAGKVECGVVYPEAMLVEPVRTLSEYMTIDDIVDRAERIVLEMRLKMLSDDKLRNNLCRLARRAVDGFIVNGRW